MERRVLLAIFLTFIVLYTWQALVVKPVPKTVPNAPGATSSAPDTSGTSTASGPSTSSSASSAVAATVPPAPATSTAAPAVSEAAERDVRVAPPDVVAVFLNRGARRKSWSLKHFLDPNKQPQDLIEQNLPTQPLPSTLRTPNDTVTATLNGALYSVSGAPSEPATSAPVDLRFEYRDTA